MEMHGNVCRSKIMVQNLYLACEKQGLSSEVYFLYVFKPRPFMSVSLEASIILQKAVIL